MNWNLYLVSILFARLLDRGRIATCLMSAPYECKLNKKCNTPNNIQQIKDGQTTILGTFKNTLQSALCKISQNCAHFVCVSLATLYLF